MANLERGFRRLTFAFSVVFASPFVVDGVLSFVEIGRIQYYLRFGILLAHQRSKRVPQEPSFVGGSASASRPPPRSLAAAARSR